MLHKLFCELKEKMKNKLNDKSIIFIRLNMNESKILLRRRAQALKAQAGALKVVSSATSRVTKLSKAVLPLPPRHFV